MLAQYDTPAELLARPADDFVARFLGLDRGLKLLSLRRLDELELAQPTTDGTAGPRADGATTPRDALALMISARSRSLVVVDAEGDPLGVATLDVLAGLAP